MTINDDLTTSEVGIALIKRFEAFRSDAYADPVGVWTIGWGTTRINGRPVTRHTPPVTKREADLLLHADLAEFEDAVRELVKVRLTQPQFDALASFTYNVGQTALGRSTLLRRLNAGDVDGAAEEFDRWVWAGGERFNGLVRRRRAERDLFESPPPPPSLTVSVAQALAALGLDVNDTEVDPLPAGEWRLPDPRPPAAAGNLLGFVSVAMLQSPTDIVEPLGELAGPIGTVAGLLAAGIVAILIAIVRHLLTKEATLQKRLDEVTAARAADRLADREALQHALVVIEAISQQIGHHDRTVRDQIQELRKELALRLSSLSAPPQHAPPQP